MKKFKVLEILLFLLIIFTGQTAFCMDKCRDTGVSWFKEAGFGTMYAATKRQSSLNNKFSNDFGIDLSASTRFFKCGVHNFALKYSYTFFFKDYSKGSRQVTVDTSFDRMDLVTGYDIILGYFSIGLHLGASFHVVNTVTEIKEVNFHIEGDQLVFDGNDKILDESKKRGLDPGFVLDISTGFDILKPFYKKNTKSILAITINTQFGVRNRRSEFTLLSGLVFYPTGLK